MHRVGNPEFAALPLWIEKIVPGLGRFVARQKFLVIGGKSKPMGQDNRTAVVLDQLRIDADPGIVETLLNFLEPKTRMVRVRHQHDVPLGGQTGATDGDNLGDVTSHARGRMVERLDIEPVFLIKSFTQFLRAFSTEGACGKKFHGTFLFRCRDQIVDRSGIRQRWPKGKLALSNNIINPFHDIIDSTPHSETTLCAQVQEYIRDLQSRQLGNFHKRRASAWRSRYLTGVTGEGVPPSYERRRRCPS